MIAKFFEELNDSKYVLYIWFGNTQDPFTSKMSYFMDLLYECFTKEYVTFREVRSVFKIFRNTFWLADQSQPYYEYGINLEFLLEKITFLVSSPEVFSGHFDITKTDFFILNGALPFHTFQFWNHHQRKIKAFIWANHR